jgi:fatty-acid desaturase
MKEGVIRPYFQEMKIFVFKYIFRHLPSYIEVPLQEKGKSTIVKTIVEKAKTIIDSVGVFYHRLVRSRSCSSSQWPSYQDKMIYTGSGHWSVIPYIQCSCMQAFIESWKLEDRACEGWLQA